MGKHLAIWILQIPGSLLDPTSSSTHVGFAPFQPFHLRFPDTNDVLLQHVNLGPEKSIVITPEARPSRPHRGGGIHLYQTQQRVEMGGGPVWKDREGSIWWQPYIRIPPLYESRNP